MRTHRDNHMTMSDRRKLRRNGDSIAGWNRIFPKADSSCLRPWLGQE